MEELGISRSCPWRLNQIPDLQAAGGGHEEVNSQKID